MTMHLEQIERYGADAERNGHRPLSDLSMDKRTMVSHGVPALVRGALLTVLSARADFARDGEGDMMANDMDHAVKFLLALREMIPER